MLIVNDSHALVQEWGNKCVAITGRHMATQADSDPVPATSDTLTKPLFRAIDASNVEELETSELESLCLACGKMVTKFIHYDDVINKWPRPSKP